MIKCTSDLGNMGAIKSKFGGTIVESVIEIHYCSIMGCSRFTTVPGNPSMTDYFDVTQGAHICESVASFLAMHNPHLDEAAVFAECMTPGLLFAVPDIITHKPERKDFYEVKPLSISGQDSGRRKIRIFTDFCQRNGLAYLPGTQYDPHEDRPITIQLWLGVPAQFRFRFFLSEPGLILWDICIETNGNIVLEAVWKSMLTRLMIALLVIAPEVVVALAAAVARAQGIAGTLSGLANSVGQDGTNDPADVQAVQIMLTDWRLNNGRSAIGMDGIIGPETIGAIQDFQQAVTGIADGRVDPGGQAITALERAHLDSLVAPAPDLIVDPNIQDVLAFTTLETLDSVEDDDGVATPAEISLEQMLRDYFSELRNG